MKDLQKLFDDLVEYIKIYLNHNEYDKNNAVNDIEELEKQIIDLIDENPKILTVKNESGQNLGMICAEYHLENVVLKCLDNHDASVQQDHDGWNIGIWAATNELETATLKALDNQMASTQQDYSGWNIGMCAASSGFKNATLKAYQNIEARKQKNDHGKTIEDYAKENGIMLDNATEFNNEKPTLFGDLHKEIFGF